ncbi:hypothetical protein KIN20_013508 [Parelaphostrongylus tenuis]|uniref:Uncharacterized protein n=1 Tax=Parelaphostrongylus tenuis TaxID=148309 RepID=A0AAD5N251_PARTN|nr:hypothetical protein KIN20_013508 [Parelaphostrongylus tenuis]
MSSPSVKVVEMDRLPLPTEISSIRSTVLEGESFRIGNKTFSKVMCIGCVKSCRYVPSLSSFEYVVIDPSANAAATKEISVIHREDVKSTNLNESQKFPIGTLVFITGRLIRFKGSVAINVYSIRELICPEEYDCLKMEAFLALQFHTKNPSGQTPVRQSRISSNFRKSFPLSTPSSSVAEKRARSSVTHCTPPSTKSTLSRTTRSDHSSRELTSSKSGMPAVSKQCSAAKEFGSQDSFEDNVLYN